MKEPRPVNLLALETTELVGSAAAFSDGNLLTEIDLDRSKRSARTLAPGIDSLLKQVGWQPSQVSLLAVTAGPGSFTGLRVGVTTAKTFAYAVGAEVLGVDTLAVLAEPVDDGEILSAAVDAQRGQVVATEFRRGAEGRWNPAGPHRLLDAGAWLGSLQPGCLVTGPVLDDLADRLPAGVRAVDRRLWRPTAAAVGRLAARLYAAGRRQDLWSLLPHYSRPSAAEEKAARPS